MNMSQRQMPQPRDKVLWGMESTLLPQKLKFTILYCILNCILIYNLIALQAIFSVYCFCNGTTYKSFLKSRFMFLTRLISFHVFPKTMKGEGDVTCLTPF